MKHLIYLAAFLLVLSCRENPTSDSTSGADTTTEIDSSRSQEAVREIETIEDIRAEYSYLTSKLEASALEITSFKYNCMEEKRGDVAYFYENGQLRLIRHTYNEPGHFSATEEYFIKDGEPFFVFYDHLLWSFVNQDETRDEITEKRFYIIDSQPVKCLQKEFTILSEANTAPESGTVSSEEVECSSLAPILDDFELLYNLRNQKEDLNCLENTLQ